MNSVFTFNNEFKEFETGIAFDFDDTLISKSNAILSYVCNILQSLHNCSIIIFSNQKNVSISKITERIQIFKSAVNIPFIAYFSLTDDSSRKPDTGMFLKFKLQYPNCKILKFVGDAAGRATDFSDSDCIFAKNCNLEFTVPESFFYPGKIISFENTEFTDLISKNKTVIFLIGYPASGKSTFALQLYNRYNYKIINNDTMGSKSNSYTIKYIATNCNIVIDNLNYTKTSRTKFLKLFDSTYTKIYIYFSKSYNYCKNMNSNREKKIPDVVFNTFRKKFEAPDSDEFNYIFTVL
jgi:DNA 3'-phosphatase